MSSALLLILALNLVPLDRITVVGDSLSNDRAAHSWPDRWKQRTPAAVLNLATPGSTAEAWSGQDLGLWVRDNPHPFVRDFVLIWLGPNDIFTGRTARNALESLMRVTENARYAGADRVAWIVGPDYGLDKLAVLNELKLEECSRDARLDCLDLRDLGEHPELFRDGIHFNVRGHRRVLHRVQAFVAGW